jgi:hypothetical protein
MIGLAIGILWFAIGVIVLGGVVWLALYGIGLFIPGGIPARVYQAVWVVFLILCVIYLLYALEGGGLPHPSLLR